MSRVLLVVLVLAAPASAMEVVADPPFIHLSGHVDKADWAAWQEALERNAGKVETVVFHNSPGGDSTTGRKIGHSIREHKLHTVVAGRCISACANMFLGGTVRQFASRDDRHEIVLGYHGSYNKKTKAVNKTKSGSYFSELTDGKMDDELIERFIRIENKNGALLLSHPSYREPLALFCAGDEPRRKRAQLCEHPKDIDALAVGVVTTWDLATVSDGKP